MHYLIFGAGAVGGWLGGRLALANHAVTFLARPPSAQVLLNQGLSWSGDGPAGRLPHPTVVTRLERAFERHPPQVILLCVKAYDVLEAAESIAAALGSPPPVVCLTNGVNNEATLAAELGASGVIAATLTTAIQRLDVGRLHVARARGLGLAGDHPLLPQLGKEMREAGLQVRLYRNPERMKWSKLLTNIVANATCAILGWKPERVYRHPGVYRLEIESLREAVRVMARMGFRPQDVPEVPVGLLGRLLFLPSAWLRPILRRVVVSGRGEKMPSFHHDIGRGRSEVHWLNGAVMRAGQAQNVATPANTLLTETLLSLVESQEAPTKYREQPERLIARARQAGVPGL